MGDRVFRSGHHPNSDLVMRRPGLGHNGGPSFDMSWEAWIWRRATAQAWKTPKPEVALMRLARAERLGITYRELTATLLDTGSYLSTVVLPLGLVARVRRDAGGRSRTEPRPEMAALVGRFPGPVFLLADPGILGQLDAAALEGLRDGLRVELDGKPAAVGLSTMPSAGSRGDGLAALLRAHGVPRKEAFMVGTGFADASLAEATGLPLFKWAHEWFQPAA